MPKVMLDVTGFYFQAQVDVPADSSVKDVMAAVQSATAGSDPEFTFSGDEYLDEIKIVFQSSPASRQDPNRKKGPGIYMYNDTMNVGANPTLAWQYYITDQDGVLVSGPDKSGKRTIVPYSESSTGTKTTPGIMLQDGYKITWRLVGILSGPNGGKVKQTGASLLTS